MQGKKSQGHTHKGGKWTLPNTYSVKFMSKKYKNSHCFLKTQPNFQIKTILFTFACMCGCLCVRACTHTHTLLGTNPLRYEQDLYEKNHNIQVKKLTQFPQPSVKVDLTKRFCSINCMV